MIWVTKQVNQLEKQVNKKKTNGELKGTNINMSLSSDGMVKIKYLHWWGRTHTEESLEISC